MRQRERVEYIAGAKNYVLPSIQFVGHRSVADRGCQAGMPEYVSVCRIECDDIPRGRR